MSIRPPTTVRARTTLAATAVVALALVASSVLLVRTLDHSLTTAADEQARTRLAEFLDQAADGALPEVLRGVGDDSLAQAVDDDGLVVGASQNILGRPPIAQVEATGTRPRVRTMRGLPDDQETEDYRIWSARTSTPDGTVAVFVGPSLESVQQVIDRLVRSLLIGLPLLVVLLALAIWVTVGRALRPMESVRREVAGFGARSLDRRVAVPATQDEVALLAATMNGMLDRLESADRTQREFVANASHDLKSPLTILRSELEMALAGADEAAWQRTGRTLLGETDRMEALVGDLLFLANAEDGGASAHRPVDLEAVVAEEVARNPRDGEVEVHVAATGAPVNGDRQALSRMVRNLLINAHAFARSRVDVEVGEVDGDAVLVIEDDGPGVPEEHREDVFARFVTLDRARHRSGGTGLGLAIARTVAESHGGTLTLDGPAPTSRFVVRLPLLGR
jgi:signal transduction histidine kinase